MEDKKLGSIGLGIESIIEEHLKQKESEYVESIKSLKQQIDALIASDKFKPQDNSFLAKYQVFSESKSESDRKLLTEAKGDTKADVSESAYFMSGGIYSDNDFDREFFVKSARSKVKYTPFMRNIKNILRSVVLSSDFKIDIMHEDTDDFVTTMLNNTNFSERLTGWIENTFIDGECFPLLFMNDKGEIKIRDIDPLEITDINYHPTDIETTISYFRQYTNQSQGTFKEVYYDAQLPDTLADSMLDWEDVTVDYPTGGLSDRYMFHFKYGYRKGRRGEMPLLPALRYDRIYEDIILDLARLYHERAKVVWILRYVGSTTEVDRTQSPVQGGTVKVETDNRRWRIENPRLSEHTSREYGAPHRSAIAASVGMPTYLVFADSSNQSYASLRKADSPVNLLVKSTQTFWSNNLKIFIKVMLREWVRRGILPETVQVEKLPAQVSNEIAQEVMSVVNYVGSNSQKLKEGIEKLDTIDRKYNITNLEEAEAKDKVETVTINTIDLPINIIFPKPESDNPLLFAQAINVLRQSQVLSQHTAMKMMGFEPDVEMALLGMESTIKNATITPNVTNTIKDMGGKKETPEKNYSRKLDRA
jgi:hypothetical protein